MMRNSPFAGHGPEKRAEAIKRMQQGFTKEEVAIDLGVPAGTVGAWFSNFRNGHLADTGKYKASYYKDYKAKKAAREAKKAERKAEKAEKLESPDISNGWVDESIDEDDMTCSMAARLYIIRVCKSLSAEDIRLILEFKDETDNT